MNTHKKETISRKRLAAHLPCIPQWACGVVSLLALIATPSIRAATTTWTHGDVDINWSSTANWSPSASPSGQDVLFKNLGAGANATTVTSIVDADYTISSLSMNYEAPVGANTTTYQNLQINSGKVLTINGGLSVGSTTETTYTSNLNYTNYLTLSGSGSLIMNGGGTANLTVLPLNTGTPQLRYRRLATLDMQTLQNFTANDLSEFALGADQNSASTITSLANLAVNNTIQASRLVMQGYFGQSYLQLGTTNKLYIDDFLIGQQDTTSPTQTWSEGTATMKFRSGVTGGTVEIRAKDGVGAANIVVGRSGLAPAAGNGGTGTGIFNLEGGTMDAKVNNFIIGLADQGTTSLTSGAAVSGTAILGAGLMEAANVVVGRTTTGNTNTNAGITSSASLTIRNDGILDISGTMTVGDAQQGTIALASTVALERGTLKANVITTGANAAGNKTVAFNWSSGSTFIQNHAGGNLTIESGVPLTLTGSTSTHTFNIDASQTGTVNSQILSAAGVSGITKTGLGTLIFTSSANSYTGATVVNAGTLLVNNVAGSGLGSGNVTIGSGGTLGGSGGFTGSVTVNGGGKLAPGASIESLGSGALTFSNNSTYSYEVDSSAATSVGADLQRVSGNLALSGTVTLTLANLGGSAFAYNTTFSLINYTGTWNNGLFTYNSTILNDGDFFAFNGQTWQIDYNSTSGGANFNTEYLGGNFVNITAVPEPGTFALIALSGAFLMTVHKRRGRM